MPTSRSRSAAPTFDPERKFSIPWQTGMTGLLVNKKLAPDIKSVNDLFDPQYKGKVTVLTEMRDTVPLMMKADGVDPVEATKEDWLEQIDKLQDAVRLGSASPLHRQRLHPGPGQRERGRGDRLVRRHRH